MKDSGPIEKTPEVSEAKIVTPAPQKKPLNKGLFIAIGCVLLLCGCCLVVALFLIFNANTPASAKDYVTKTETNYKDVKTQFAKLDDSIVNDYAVDAVGEKYEDIKTKVDNAYAIAASLETKVADAEKLIPNAGTDTKTLDTDLRDYYKATKSIATSYKDLLTIHQATLPVLKDVEAMSVTLAGFSSAETAADFSSYGNKVKEQRALFVTHQNNLVNIKTTPENAFVKDNLKTTISAVIDLLDAFIKFTDKAALAMQNSDTAAITAASDELTQAGTKFQNITSDTSFKTSKTNLINSFKSQLESIKTKQTATDTEYSKVKAAAGI